MFVGASLADSELGFPILEILHIAGFGVAIGTTAAVDFRILGIGLMKQTPSQISKSIANWMLGGLLISIFSGFALYSTDPDTYLTNLSFMYKMAALTLVIVLNFTVHRKIANTNSTGGGAKLMALVSLVLWASVIFGGIFIAFIRGGI
jgi:hypothetical protein